MKKAFPYILLGLLAIAALLIKRCRNAAPGGTIKAGTETVDRNNRLDRRTGLLEYTEHAKCRMDCIHTTQQQVAHILEKGEINAAKTETGARPCPIYVLDGYTTDSLHLQVVFAQCDYKTKVMSCRNLDAAEDCHCSGPGSKYDHP
jgi:hypothetical protein